MILPDTNLLIYAYNRDARQHASAHSWLEENLAGVEPIALTWATLSGFLRVCTNRRAVAKPISVEQAIEIVDEWLAQPTVHIIRPGERHWSILTRMLQALKVGGNLVSDAHLAALAIEHDCELCSPDSDFARFPELRWRNPLGH
ncbi:MAG TPA: type II toxin-antitoxin system VapC family toxin [Chthoniobacterales bacterium]|nr:type II toxin-antitoxin system VapC family toxin [Chthoniobacterales bacterium]